MNDYLSDSPAILNNPGTKLNDVYYNKMNTSVNEAEISYNMGRYNTALSSLRMPSTTQIFIPSGSLIDNAILFLRLPDISADQQLCRGWGYGCIQSISYILGSTNTSQYEITGVTLWDVVSRMAQTSEKRSELFRLGGEEKLLPSGSSSNAYVILPIPQFGELCKGQKPMDSRLLSDQITIQITFRRPESILGGTGPFANSFEIGQCYLRQGEFSNLESSISTAMRRNKELIYSQPFIHHQSFPLTPTSDGNGRIEVVLQSFLNADLLGITLSVIRTDDFAETGDSPNPFNYQNMRDVVLKYNGKDMYNCPGDMSRIMGLLYEDGAHYFENSVIDASGTFSTPVNSRSVWIDLSRFNSTCYSAERGFNNTPRFSNNTMQLSFSVNDINTNFQLMATYHYNAVVVYNDMHSYIYY